MGRVRFRWWLATGVLAVWAFALAGPPAQFDVVERLVAGLTEGRILQVRAVLASEAVLTEHDVFVRSVAGAAAHARMRELVPQGARLEVSFESASADGALVVTRERLWLDDVPQGLVPLRSTVAYVVDGVRLLSITRVLDADQRDVLLREAIVGAWRYPGYVFEWHADGTYDIVVAGSVAYDSGAYIIEGGVMRVVSGDQAVSCQPGDVGLWRVSFTSPDRHMLDKIEDACTVGRAGPRLVLNRLPE